MSIIPSFIISTSLFFCAPKFQTGLCAQWEDKTIATPVWFICTNPFPFLQIDFGTITQQGIVNRANPGTLEISNSTTFSECPKVSYSINHPQEATANTKPIAFATTYFIGPSSLTFFSQISSNLIDSEKNHIFDMYSTSFFMPLNFKKTNWNLAAAIQNYKSEVTETNSWYDKVAIHNSSYHTAISAETALSTFFFSDNTYGTSEFQFYLGGTIAEQDSSIPKGLFRINTNCHTPFGGLSIKAFCCDFGFTGIDGIPQKKTVNVAIEPQICIPFFSNTETSYFTANATGTFYFKPATNSMIDSNTINKTLLIAMEDCQTYMAFSAANSIKKHNNTITFSAVMQDIICTKNYLLLTDETTLKVESDIKIKFSGFDLNTGVLAFLEPESILQVIEHTYKIGISSKFVDATAKSTIANSKLKSWNIGLMVSNIYGFSIKSTLTNQGNLTLKLNYSLKIIK